MRKRAPDLGLENNNDGKDEIRKHVRQQPRNGLKPDPPREIEKHHNQRKSQRHLDCTSPFDEHEQLVDEERDNEDVQHSGPGQRWQCEIFH